MGNNIKATCLWAVSNVMAFILRRILALRYKIKFVGDKIPANSHGVLVIPNHPALIDPLILTSHMWEKLHLRPMAWEPGIASPLISWIKPLVNPVLIKNSVRDTPQAKEQAQAALNEVIKGLNAGENHIMYPSGRLYRSGYESLGKVRGLTQILKESPNTKILVVRTSGLLGSSFGFHFTGDTPDITKCVLRAAWMVLTNFVFFIPKRKVTIELEWINRNTLPELEVEKINKFFEDKYNKNGEQHPIHVSPLFFRKSQKDYKFSTIVATFKR